MVLHFTTLFDKNYLSRALVLYESLIEHCSVEFDLYALCLDDTAESFFRSNTDIYKNIKVIGLSELEEFDKYLSSIKASRSLISYYFTISPCLPRYLLNKFNLDHICSLDADIIFLSNPISIFGYLQDYSIIITPHKFTPENKWREKYGLFNVSFQIFKNNQKGNECLDTWRKQCIDWCEDIPDNLNNRFADQMYLNGWKDIYKSELKVLDDNVSGIAAWNLNNYKLEYCNGYYFSNNERLIYYHFHNFKLINRSWAVSGIQQYEVKANKAIKLLYLNYLEKLIIQNSKNLSVKSELIRHPNYSHIIRFIAFESIIYHISKQNRILQYNLNFIPRIFRKVIFKLSDILFYQVKN